VIRGIIPPLPSLSRQQPRGMRMGNGNFGSFDPSFRAQQQQQQLHMIQQQRQAAAQAQQNGTEQVTPATESSPSVEGQITNDKPSFPSSVPPKPVAATNPPASMPTIVRSASQPGVVRVHANGFSSRSHSPAPSNVSFHGHGHPRRAGSRVPFPNANGSAPANGDSRSASVDRSAKQQLQRIPGADEFPALGGASASLNGAQQANGKTAAQVLSAPAPVKPVNSKGEDGDDSGSASDQSEQNVGPAR
jgi:hypothetical protein